jgi:hypothetical protein
VGALRGKRDQIILAAKAGGPMGPALWQKGSSRKHLQEHNAKLVLLWGYSRSLLPMTMPSEFKDSKNIDELSLLPSASGVLDIDVDHDQWQFATPLVKDSRQWIVANDVARTAG